MRAITANSAVSFTSVALERHYAPDELGKIWGLSADTVRRLFECEAGVLMIEHDKGKTRRYRTFRIPESVALRVHRRMSNA
jgi:hypothetical protein